MATAIASTSCVVRGAAPRVELLAQRAGEEERVRLADDDAPPQLRERERRDRDAAERDETVVDEAAEPVCEPDALVGTGRDDAREHAGLDDESRPRVCEQRSLRRCRLERVGLADQRLDPDDRQHPLCPDERSRDLVDGLGRDPQRDDEEGGIAVEGDELAGADAAVDSEPRAQPGDEDDEDAGQEHLRRVERRLRQRDPDAGQADLLRASPVALEEDPLAADPTQHAQARRPCRRRARSAGPPAHAARAGVPGAA